VNEQTPPRPGAGGAALPPEAVSARSELAPPVLVALEAPSRLEPTHIAALGRLVPGLALAGAIAVAGVLLSLRFGGPAMLFALLLGMAFHTVAERKVLKAGVDLAARFVLRVGVALLGARITLGDMLALPWIFWLIAGAAVPATILFGAALARTFGRAPAFGVLTGGATAICGASAALAISAVLPRHPDADRDAIFAVIGVTTLSTVAMVVYPWAFTAATTDERLIGFLIGASIHDVAQVVGAGYSVSVTAGDVAMITKLWRVAMLVPVVAALMLLYRRRGPASGGPRPSLLPWFLVVFVALSAIASAGLIGRDGGAALGEVSRWCLLAAVAALGMKTSLAALLTLGWRPVGLIVAETLFLALLVLAGGLGAALRVSATH
jgi:uncharacterized integral membrane protein (TIGR00698 family)